VLGHPIKLFKRNMKRLEVPDYQDLLQIGKKCLLLSQKTERERILLPGILFFCLPAHLPFTCFYTHLLLHLPFHLPVIIFIFKFLMAFSANHFSPFLTRTLHWITSLLPGIWIVLLLFLAVVLIEGIFTVSVQSAEPGTCQM